MSKKENRRSFLKKLTLSGLSASAMPGFLFKQQEINPLSLENSGVFNNSRQYNEPYRGDNLSRVAFPIGGMGAGMFCLEGRGAISHMSVRNRPEIYNEPDIFAAISVKGVDKGAKIIEGPVQTWKKFGQRGSGNGSAGAIYGLPRFQSAEFTTRFPFGTIDLKDKDIPFDVRVKGWSPFIPTDEDNSSLPVGALEYTFVNKSHKKAEAVFSFNSKNFIQEDTNNGTIKSMSNGFVLSQGGEGTDSKPSRRGDFAVFTDQPDTKVDYCWFRGGWWDPLTMVWNTIEEGTIKTNDPVDSGAPGASLFVPLNLAPGEEKTIRIMMSWYVPLSDLRIGKNIETEEGCDLASGCCSSPAELGLTKSDGEDEGPVPLHYRPWYSTKFKNIRDMTSFWKENYDELQQKSDLFSKAFYSSTLPPEVIEAVAANLTILKSPTVMRQSDGRMWNWEGCSDDNGCCHGSCTHVWNYAQAVPHLFPALERSLRLTEFCEDQNMAGHQNFRAFLPIRSVDHGFYAASDGQLGGIMKAYREWRISGDANWLEKMYPLVKKSMDYCIKTWDPKHKGIVEEPHHNTYDIEFWGPDGMCTSFYLGALSAISKMGSSLNEDVSFYGELYEKGKKYTEDELFDGEYFFQKIKTKGLEAANPVEASRKSFHSGYSDEALQLLQKEGPKYQYGKGCLSDGILGAWIARMCGLEDPLDSKKIESHIVAVHKYNLKKTLSDHANPQRPAYALGDEGGLLLCTWPKGGKLSLPFVYSDEVWTGIEYQVASHLMLMGQVEKGLEVVRACRERYDGRTRNPFNEYECGHWYARAMSSYGLLQGLTGVRYDAVDKILCIDSKVGDFTSFLSTETGFGTVTLKGEKPSMKVYNGNIPVRTTEVSGRKMKLSQTTI